LEQYRTIEEDISAVRAVTIDDVHSLIEQFNPGDFTQLSIGPAQSS
jgi:predicted Zn-dependent peptidase